MGGFTIGPDYAAALLVLGEGQRLGEAVEDLLGILVGEHPQQGETRAEAQGAGAALDRAGHDIGELLGEELPALAAAFLVGGHEKRAAPAARHQPWAIQLGIGEMHQAAGDFHQRAIAGGLAIGQIDGLETAETQHQRVDAGGFGDGWFSSGGTLGGGDILLAAAPRRQPPSCRIKAG